MDPTRQQIFDQLAATLNSVEYSLADIFETFHGFSSRYPGVASAFAFHGNVILHEQQASQQQDTYTYSSLLAEIYRRTFFDPQFDGLSGEHTVIQDIDKLRQWAGYIIDSIAMDRIQNQSGNFHETPSNRQ